MVKNVVLARVVGSRAEFKQIVGRGTRLKVDYGKEYFNIIDFTGTATTLRKTSGEPVVHDGPFAETKEHLGGFVLIAARDLNEAISIAARMPVAQLGRMGVR